MTPNHHSPAGNLLGVKVSPETIAQWIQRPNREFLAKLLTGLANPKYFALLNAGDGINKVTVQGEVILGPEGMTVTLDLSNLPASSGSGGGGGGTSGLLQFKFQNDVSTNGDYWVVKSWDGTNLGAVTQFIIKPEKLRCSAANAIASETIRGVVRTYAYVWDSTYLEWKRTTSGSDGSASTDYCTPPMLASSTYGYDILYALPVATGISGIPSSIAAAALVAGGSGYAVNQVLTLAGGAGTPATLKVTSESGGVITGIQLLASGSYSVAPTLIGAGVTVGSATFNLTLAPQLLDMNVDGRKWATGP